MCSRACTVDVWSTLQSMRARLCARNFDASASSLPPDTTLPRVSLTAGQTLNERGTPLPAPRMYMDVTVMANLDASRVGCMPRDWNYQ